MRNLGQVQKKAQGINLKGLHAPNWQIDKSDNIDKSDFILTDFAILINQDGFERNSPERLYKTIPS